MKKRKKIGNELQFEVDGFIVSIKKDRNKKKFEEALLEKCSEAVHKAYCNYYLKNKGEAYWTKGDYSLLDEPTKQIDRETVKAVFNIVWEWIEKK